MGSVYRRQRRGKDGKLRVGSIWYVQYYRSGKKFRESSGSTRRAVAERILREREGTIARGEPVVVNVEKIPFEELLDDVLVDYRVMAYRTLDSAERRIRKHIEPFFRGARAMSINPSHVKKFVVHRQEQGASNAEINRELALVARAFNLAKDNLKLTRSPRILKLPEYNARQGFFEADQFEALGRHLSPELQPLVQFLHVTGWRRREVQGLKWRNVDFAGGVVSLDAKASKNREARTFPFTDDLQELLERQRQVTSRVQREQGIVVPWVFHRNGRQILDFRGAWKAACRKAGCPGMIPHDFRRTAVRNLVRAGVPERVAMRLTGHRTRAVFERYNIVSVGDLQMAADKLNEASGRM